MGKLADTIPFIVQVYVESAKNRVESMYSFHPFGMSERRDGGWYPTTREESNLQKYYNSEEYKVYQIDWNKAPKEDFDVKELDPFNEREWEHELVARFDDGEALSAEDVSDYAEEVETGEAQETAEEAKG